MRCFPSATPIYHDTPLSTINADVIINCGWPTSSQLYHDEQYQEQGVLFLRNLLASVNCRKFIGVGSQSEVYRSDTVHAKIREKARSEASTECRRRGIDFAWMRVFSVYGTGDTSVRFIPYIIDELLHGRVPVLSNCELMWDFLHVSDAASAFVKVATCGATGVFDVGSGTPVRMRDVAIMIRDMIDPTLRLEFGRRPVKSYDLKSTQADTQRLRDLGWKPEIDIHYGLRMLIEETRK